MGQITYTRTQIDALIAAAVGGIEPGGSVGQVQIHGADGGFAGDAGLTYNSSTNDLSVGGGVDAQAFYLATAIADGRENAGLSYPSSNTVQLYSGDGFGAKVEILSGSGQASLAVGPGSSTFLGDVVTLSAMEAARFHGRPQDGGTVGVEIDLAESHVANAIEVNSYGTGIGGDLFRVEANGSVVTSGSLTVADEAYGSGWNGSLEVPTKNALYDKIETLGGEGGSPGGSDTQVQFNDGGSFGGDSGLTFNKTTNALAAGSFNGGHVTVANSANSSGRRNWRLVSRDDAFRVDLYSDDNTTLLTGGCIAVGPEGIYAPGFFPSALTVTDRIVSRTGSGDSAGLLMRDSGNVARAFAGLDGTDWTVWAGASVCTIRVPAAGRVLLRDPVDDGVSVLQVNGAITAASLNLGGECFLANISTPATPSGGGILFAQGGELKYVGSSGTVTTIAPA